MNSNVLIGGIALTIFSNIFFISDFYIHWIKQDSLNAIFPTWKGTKKKYLWFFIWSIFLNFNIIVFVILNFILNITGENFAVAFYVSYMGWGIVDAIIYFNIRDIVAKRIKRNSKKPK